MIPCLVGEVGTKVLEQHTTSVFNVLCLEDKGWMLLWNISTHPPTSVVSCHNPHDYMWICTWVTELVIKLKLKAAHYQSMLLWLQSEYQSIFWWSAELL